MHSSMSYMIPWVEAQPSKKNKKLHNLPCHIITFFFFSPISGHAVLIDPILGPVHQLSMGAINGAASTAKEIMPKMTFELTRFAL